MVMAEPNGIGLRDYQAEAVAAVLAGYAAGAQRQIVALPTGCGKTVVGVQVAAERRGRTLFLVHTDELVQQTVASFDLWLPSVPVGIVKADRDDTKAPIVVASIQTLARPRRLAALTRASQQMGAPFRTVITDEAHHSLARSWLDVLYGVGAFDLDMLAMAEQAEAARHAGHTHPRTRLIPHKAAAADAPLLLGLTATPERGDGLALDLLWQRIAYQRSLLDMILAGWLCDLQALQVGRELDLSGVRTVAGDFDDGALGAALVAQGVPDELAAAYRQHAPGRKALVFVPTVAMAQVTTDAFRAQGIAAALITGTTPLAERRAQIAALRGGALGAIVNVGVLTEGFDAPVVDCVLIGRPTQSRPLYTQMVGRGTRLFPGKADCLVLELVGRNTRHKIVTVDDLLGRPQRSAPAREEALPAAAASGPVIDRAAETKAINLFSSAAWITLATGAYYLAVPGGGVLLRPAGADTYAIIRQEGARETALYHRPLAMPYAQGLVEDLIRRNRWQALTDPTSGWRAAPATDRQRAKLWVVATDPRVSAELRAQAKQARGTADLTGHAASAVLSAYDALGLPRREG